MAHFTPLTALIGGLLIGLSAVLLLWLNGRIAGISGIASHLLSPARGEVAWRVLFLVGLVAGAGLWYAWTGKAPASRSGLPGWLLALAGLLVGYGTALASGCTSGHGVCGLGRFSFRSLAAVLVFMTAAIVTTWLLRHGLGVQF